MWLDRVKRVYGDDLEVTWKNFSLEQVNSKEGPEWKSWEQGDPTERRSLLSQMAAEAARRQGPELYDKFHLALLTARHGGDDRIALNEEEPLIELAQEKGTDERAQGTTPRDAAGDVLEQPPALGRVP